MVLKRLDRWLLCRNNQFRGVEYFMKKYKSLGVNAFLNAFKSGLSVLFPLVTYPYAYRILHAEGIGRVDYATSIVNYFTMIAALGITTYAVREGSKIRERKSDFEVFSNQIFSFNVITTVLTYIFLAVFLVFFSQTQEYGGLITLLSLSIVFTSLGVEWINTIYEDYLYITVRSVVIHVVTLILLFILVRDENDYYFYAFLTVITNGIICLTNLVYCRRYVKLRFTFKINLSRHISPILLLFANSVATTIYVSADTTMLGWTVGEQAVGFYSIASKVYGVVKRMLVAMYSVAISRISFYVGQGDTDNIRRTYTKLLSNLTLVLIPASVGLISISREIIVFMGGQEYFEAIPTLQILSISLIGAIFGGAVTYCLNIPLGRERINVMATVLSAIINIGLNIVFIPLLRQNGAAITTAISEFFVFIFCFVSFKNKREYIDFPVWRKNIFHSLIGVALIVIITYLVRLITSNPYLVLIFVISFSVLAYFGALLALKNDFVLGLAKKIKSRF